MRTCKNLSSQGSGVCDRKNFEKLSLMRKFQIFSSVFPPVSLDLYGQTYMHRRCIYVLCIKKELAISGLMESDVIRSVWLDI